MAGTAHHALSCIEFGVTDLAGPYEFPGGRRFEFTDPSRNRLGVFSHA